MLGLGESCNHEATKQSLSEVEITSFVPEAVAANHCARCDKYRRDIDKLNTEIADLKKKAVIANPCSACCDTHGWDIDRLNAEISNLKKKIAFLEGEELANSSMNMQIIHLQRDHSSLIKTVEMLSKQLLNLSEGKGENPTNIPPVNLDKSNVLDPTSKACEKKKKKSQKKQRERK